MGYLKLAKIFGPLLILAMIGGYILHLRKDRDGWKNTAHVITAELQKVGGFTIKGGKPPKPKKHGVDMVRKLGAQRDQARGERNDYLRRLNDTKEALIAQSNKVLELGAEAQRLRELSRQQAALVRKLTGQRDSWIRKAERAATRTERLSAQEEARQCEEAMDALYQAGF